MKKNYKKMRLPLLFHSLLVLLLSFSAGATIYPFHNTLTGSQEVPPNASLGKGTIVGWYNDETNTISYTIIFGGLLAPTVAGHFHAPAPPGVNAAVIIGYAGFPTGVTSGSYSNTNVLTDLQETQLLAGLMYSNIHTSMFPGGEIRAQITLGNPSTTYIFSNVYSGLQEVPPNSSSASGRIIGSYNHITNTISYMIIFSGLTTPASAAHFHAPAPPGVNAPVIIPLAGFPAATAGTYSNTHVITDLQESQLLSNLWYANIHNVTFPGGEIRAQIIPNIPAAITCPANIVLSNTPGQCSRSVSFAATTTGNPAPAVVYKIGATVISSPYLFNVGTTTVTATATNAGGIATCSFTVTINDTEAPSISNMTATPNNLWPPNHKMHDVTVNYTSSDNCPGVVNCRLSVTSNEPVNGKGDGNTSPDWIVIDDHHVKLRAERSGNGDGRVYTITATCTDQYGNSGSSSTTVTVSHDKSKSSSNGNTVAGNIDFGIMLNGLSLKAFPNPARNEFMLKIQSGNSEKISVRITDIAGRVVESKYNLTGNQVLRVGSNLKAGVYIVRIMQGQETQQVKLVKVE